MRLKLYGIVQLVELNSRPWCAAVKEVVYGQAIAQTDARQGYALSLRTREQLGKQMDPVKGPSHRSLCAVQRANNPGME
ncbi:hypothetical protein PS850_00283 [Pseudomonas fluorescens]|nr:hypothetical protein PS850_00283 [Pseudomonas fluorescens]